MTPQLTIQDERKKFERCAEKYYTTLDNYLRMSVKKKDPNIMEVSCCYGNDLMELRTVRMELRTVEWDIHW